MFWTERHAAVTRQLRLQRGVGSHGSAPFSLCRCLVSQLGNAYGWELPLAGARRLLLVRINHYSHCATVVKKKLCGFLAPAGDREAVIRWRVATGGSDVRRRVVGRLTPRGACGPGAGLLPRF